MPRLIVFDCDGVLVDSEPVANRVLRDALAAEGLDLSLDEVIERYVGRSMRTVVGSIEQELGRSLDAAWLDRLQERTFDAFRESLQPIPGIEAALDAIETLDARTCVASSGTHDKMRLTLGLTGLDQRFTGRIFSATEVERGKPAPDLFLHAARRMSVEPQHAVVVEDSAPGIEGAVAAGMRAIGYATRGQTQGLRDAGADVVIDDMRALPALLAG